ncbi:MAG TPA: signal peptidase II [Thermoleophilaceae bacterium]|nr:signal peptidase II [Thermoleophilaceae bacterium]
MSRAAGWGRAAATLAVVVVVDQATKALAVARIDRGDEVNVFFGLDLTNTRNRGVAFGALQGSATVVGLLIAAALVLLVGYFVLNASRPLLWLPVGMLLGGAAGNLVDRAREGAVIDFIDPTFWPAFNLADASIVIGVFALLYVVEGKRE